MKKRILYFVILVTGLILVDLSANQVYSQTTQNKPVKQQGVTYTCPNHPKTVQDHPGNCPICGMKLVENTNMQKGDMHHSNDSTMMNHSHNQMMNDSTTMKNRNMMHDSTSMKHEHMGM